MENTSGIIITVLVFASLFGFVTTSGCTSLIKEPTISVTNMDLSSITPTDLVMNVTLRIDNPNPLGLTLKSVQCNITYLKDTTWAPLSHAEKEGLEIRPGTNQVTIPVHAKNSDLVQAGFDMIKEGKITITAEGTVEPSFFGLSSKIPFTRTETVPFQK